MNNLIYGTTDEALELIMSGANCCITGPGGSGKSSLINTIKTFFEDDTLLVGPTGLSALNIGGQTCHRTFSLGFGIYKRGDPLRLSKTKRDLLSSDGLYRIVIDEAFCLRQDKFVEIIDKLRMARRIKKGEPLDVQIVCLGDVLQIGPVTSNNEKQEYFDNYNSPYFFDCKTFDELDFQRIELTKIHRQKDKKFVRVLGDIRKGVNIKEAVSYINSKTYNNQRQEGSVVIATTNAKVDAINNQELSKLNTREHTFTATLLGDFKEEPSPKLLKIKEGCQVIVTANKADEKGNTLFSNGNVGIVERIQGHRVLVRITDNSELKGKVVELKKHTWYNIEQEVVGHTFNGKQKIEDKIIGSYTQFPLKLCYAITSHKCQGQTLDKAHIDFGRGCFSPSQAYVALSRLKSTEGLTLERSIKESDIFVDSKALKYYC